MIRTTSVSVPIIFALFTFITVDLAFAHGGGLNAQGCHNNRKTGEYHCHRSGSPIPKIDVSCRDKYDRRKCYGDWIDINRDCQNTKQEVLIAESVVEVTLDEKGCKVIAGLWKDPFTGLTVTDPGLLEIDHFIPLAEAHRSGANLWTQQERKRYANDLENPDTLIAVTGSVNRSKGARDPSRWMPPNRDYWCEYLETWIELKRNWKLTMDQDEKVFLKNNRCVQ